MNENIGKMDRIVRAIVGAAIMFAGYALGLTTIYGILAVLLGIILMLTAATGFCLLYKIIGLSTLEKPTTKPKKRK